jgi:integrase
VALARMLFHDIGRDYQLAMASLFVERCELKTSGACPHTGYCTTVIALRLMLLTFVRTKELRQAHWAEFDLDRREWRIPPNRMKMHEAHIVPLSRQAIALLRELHTYTGWRTFLFPNCRIPDTLMTAMTLNRALERMGFNGRDSIGFSAHGFRATASTILNEIGFAPT